MSPTLVYPAPTGPLKLEHLPVDIGWTSLSTRYSSFPSPDIEWDPSLDTYLERVKRLASLGEALPRTLPLGFPASISSPRAWKGSEFEDGSKYIYELSKDDLDEIDAAIRTFSDQFKNAVHPDPDQLTPTTFPLPGLGRKLEQLSNIIHFGQGFFVVRGLDPHRYSPSERVLAYAGITSYVGSTRACQDAGGSKLIHIKDRGMAFPGAEMRQAPYSNVAQPFHTDELAAEGGHFQLASSGQVYNDIAASRPDVIQTLAANKWIFDKFSKNPAWDVRPILLPFGPHGPSFFFSRRPLTGSLVAPRIQGVPPMTERQAEALDMVHFSAVKHQLRLDAQRGDVILVNNLAVMHARTAFTDGVPGKGAGRHVMRMWLRNDELAWPKPDMVKPIFDLKYSPDSPWCGKPVWHLEPPTLPERMLARKFSCS
ncbi:hypothetical protein B0T24DRAFT_592157 [Lasiosphaeria ovina]|uniref:TauD/TfdA-like domain-containing protein n=1 Tax=Lasiosphaeria ovina TaxID=92902 RepID=A0AAE0KGR5_9PEZI|nr:hypothetical protein B0T24DRAFT_592157 [Lasiosphaeria ovina]